MAPGIDHPARIAPFEPLRGTLIATPSSAHRDELGDPLSRKRRSVGFERNLEVDHLQKLVGGKGGALPTQTQQL